ncbi:MAG: hypothetical protein HZA12_03310 [Nitrospirae bacterium]|nr:hypothetical protein [Nitrospirota bacterium]
MGSKQSLNIKETNMSSIVKTTLVITWRLLQKSMSSPKSSIGDMIFCNKTLYSRLNHAGMTTFLYFCKSLTVFSLLILITNTAQAFTIGTFEWNTYSEDDTFLYGPYFFSVTNDSFALSSG